MFPVDGCWNWKNQPIHSFLQAAVYVNPISLFRFASLSNLSARDHSALQTQGLVYFVYLFLYSGLEFTLTFLTHNRFNFTSMQQVMPPFGCYTQYGCTPEIVYRIPICPYPT